MAQSQGHRDGRVRGVGGPRGKQQRRRMHPSRQGFPSWQTPSAGYCLISETEQEPELFREAIRAPCARSARSTAGPPRRSWSRPSGPGSHPGSHPAPLQLRPGGDLLADLLQDIRRRPGRVGHEVLHVLPRQPDLPPDVRERPLALHPQQRTHVRLGVRVRIPRRRPKTPTVALGEPLQPTGQRRDRRRTDGPTLRDGDGRR
jgi:hypothetical protein